MNLPLNYMELTTQERRVVREEYVKKQNGKCMYCGQSLCEEPPEWVLSRKVNWSLFPKNFLMHPIHLQHDHVTGMTEGAVHAYCNAVMWQYERR